MIRAKWILPLQVWVFTTSSLGEAQNIPSSADPGVVVRSLPEYRQPVNTLSIEGRKAESSKQLPVETQSVTFPLSAIRLDGNTVYTPEQLLPLYSELLGTTVSLAVLHRVADEITAQYQRDGYLLSFAIIPAQEINQGIVTIKIIEGSVDRVLVNQGSDIPVDISLIQHFLRQITAEKPLNTNKLERQLLMINTLPGIAIETVLKASPDKPDVADLYVFLIQKPLQLAATLDNRGTQYLGPERLSVQLTGNSLLGRSERISVGLNTTRGVDAFGSDDPGRFNYVSMAYRENIGYSGQQWFVNANVGSTHPASVDALAGLDIEGDYQQYSIGLLWPVRYQRTERFIVQGRFDYQQTDSHLASELITRDRVRSLRLAGLYQFADAGAGINTFRLELSTGLDILNASDNDSTLNSREGGRSDYWKLTFNASRTQPLTSRLEWSWSGMAQWSGTELLAGEEFALGGPGLGGAYDSGELTGEHGVAVRTQVTHWLSGSHPLLSGAGVYGYYDVGLVWDRSDDQHTRSSLTSSGAGITLDFGRVNLNLELAMPMNRHVESERAASHGKGPRLFFSLSGSF